MKMIDLAEKFKQEKIYYELYEHRAIYTNEDALVVKSEKGFTGTETKSLFLKGKDGRNFVLLTFTTKRTDFKLLKHVIGEKLSIVPSDEMEEQTGQKPGAVSPFGYPQNVPLIVDEELYSKEKLVFAPGRPDRTMVVLGKDLPKIIEMLGNEYFIYSDDEDM